MVEQQINAEHAQFETLIARLKREQDSRLEDLKAQLQAVGKVIEVAAWQHNIRAAVALAAQPPQRPKSQQPPPLANVLIRKLSEGIPKSSEDLCRLAVSYGLGKLEAAQTEDKGKVG